MLENTIRSGMLGQLTHVLAAVNSKSTIILNNYNFNYVGKNPIQAKQQLMNSTQIRSYGENSKCDIPLREPLDPEHRLNRKLAKQIYNKERRDKVIAHKEE